MMDECKHNYKLVQAEDAKIEPEWVSQKVLSTITKTYKCGKCGHIKSVIGADEEDK
jgi:hypothetical protein